VIGSTLHRLAFPEHHEKHLKSDRKLLIAHEHPGKDVSEQFLQPFLKADVRSVLARGEYLYAACGEAGVRVFDIAFIDHKGFSERFATAPVSPLGQRFFVRTKHAMAVAAPTTIAPDPTRTQYPENREQAVHAMYGNIYVADKYEGLVVIGAATLLDGNPLNNFLERSLTFNPDGVLTGARNISIVGTYAYISCDAGLVVVSIDDPNKPVVKSVVGAPHLNKPGAVEAQFRYAFVCDADGVKVLEITDPANPRPAARIALPEARGIYVARTYAYVAAGKHGLVILDVENPERPFVDQVFNADGCIDDLNDVKLGITYSSLFAYLADGKNGLRVVQLTSPEIPTNQGFSPRPEPRLIATRKLPEGGKALAVSRGVDRDRAVDEGGNQIAVFGRIGARPLNLAEQRKLYLRGGGVWRVDDDPRSPLYRQR
jgi:hypothetical protein